MRDRHLPRLCPACHGPMARQEDACWRCGARPAEEPTARTPRLAVPPVLTIVDGNVADAAVAASVDADRWVNEGGTFPGPDRAVATVLSGAMRT
jgi:hypothetical protein